MLPRLCFPRDCPRKRALVRTKLVDLVIVDVEDIPPVPVVVMEEAKEEEFLYNKSQTSKLRWEFILIDSRESTRWECREV